jgi:hypothetical protein
LTQDLIDYGALLAGLLMVIVYEVLLRRRTAAGETARSVHTRLREEWLVAIEKQPGSEIVAIQTVRNSLMSATINASTAALAFMGTISLALPRLSGAVDEVNRVTSREVMALLLMGTLFASCMCSVMAMRYANHLGYVVSAPVNAGLRRRWAAVAGAYLRRSGAYYGWGWRLFLMGGPLAIGVSRPWLMPVATLVLVTVLRYFDRPAGLPSAAGEDDESPLHQG